ncbi:MAG TPA: DUF4382 domain-containing protein [Terriglobales bacterium]|jgi:hypothetical protein|nr:DUF4382 domain-containing protein [Terriglobales bacterium]
MPKHAFSCVAISLTLATLAFLLGCSGGSSNSSTTPSMATINVSISDPAPCAAPQGPFSHVYVTITDVQINASANAADNDPGWIDLAPNLKQNPQQVDLLAQASNQCFLAMLASGAQLQPGSYQQLRIFLANNATVVKSNVCAGTANCVMLSSDPTNSPLPLLLSSQAQTGLKIPSGQIAGGQFVIAPGETKDLNLDFSACASIIAQGNGQFRLKPVLHAGEVSLTASSINGKIVDSITGQPISGGTTIVALEQTDSSGVDRVIMETLTDSAGVFVFCPVTSGTYDVVAVAVDGVQIAYGATVITGVQPGNALGTVPLVAETGASKSPASITGQVTTTTGSAATAADISLSALQSISVSNSPVLVTIPLVSQSSATANLTTASGASCPAKTDCATYTLSVPALNPSFGSFSSSGMQKPAPPAGGAVGYTVDARAFVSGGGADCNPSQLQTSSTSTNTPLVVTPGTSVTAATLAFTSCQ